MGDYGHDCTVLFLTFCDSTYLLTKHDTNDISDPSSMQDACHVYNLPNGPCPP